MWVTNTDLARHASRPLHEHPNCLLDEARLDSVPEGPVRAVLRRPSPSPTLSPDRGQTVGAQVPIVACVGSRDFALRDCPALRGPGAVRIPKLLAAPDRARHGHVLTPSRRSSASDGPSHSARPPCGLRLTTPINPLPPTGTVVLVDRLEVPHE